jgi:hypothetical protein
VIYKSLSYNCPKEAKAISDIDNVLETLSLSEQRMPLR